MADHQAPFIGHARAQMNGGLRELARHLCELEQSLLQPDVRKSPALVDLLDDDFTEFGTSGRIYTKSDLLEALQAESPSKQTASDFKVTTLSPGAALLTYRIRLHREPPVLTLRSSIWRRTGGDWKLIFHQATITK
jgi:hypothetical protein